MTGKIVEITRALSGRFHLTLELNEDDKVKTVYDQLHDKGKERNRTLERD